MANISTLKKQLGYPPKTCGIYGGTEYTDIKEGKLSDFVKRGKNNPCDYHGVYVVYRDNGEIIYVGEAYKSTVGKRLHNHISGNLKNSSFAKHFAQKDLGIDISVPLSPEDKERLRTTIGNLNVLVFNCTDLETVLIDELQPYYNKITGNKKPRAKKPRANKNRASQTPSSTQPTP